MQQRQFSSGSRQAPDPFDQFLEQHNFYRKHTARDASCLFRVISEQMYDTQMHHLIIRQKCVNYIRKNRNYFEKYIEGNFDEYLTDMLKPKTFGTLVELQAAGKMFKRNILLFEPYDLGNYFDDFKPYYSEVFRVFYTPEKHFDSVFTSEYIEDAAICQSICYEILYGDLFKLPDISFAVEQMLHNTTFENVSYDVKANDEGYYTRLVMSDGRTFELDRPENTNCILENYKLCHFHYDEFPTFSNDLQRQLRLSQDDAEKNTSLLRTTAALLPDKHISCVRQLLLAGITPFPYKVAKALDSSIYRNIEFDVWNEIRKEMKWSNWYNGGLDFKMLPITKRNGENTHNYVFQVGAKCHVQLYKSENTLYTCHIQEILMEKGLCTVFIEQLGEKRLVPYESLKPLPLNQFKPWCLPYRYQKQIQAKETAAATTSSPSKVLLRSYTPRQYNNYRLKLNKTSNDIININDNNRNNFVKTNENSINEQRANVQNNFEENCTENNNSNYMMGKRILNEVDQTKSKINQHIYNEKQDYIKFPEYKLQPCDLYGGTFIYGGSVYPGRGTSQGFGMLPPYNIILPRPFFPTAVETGFSSSSIYNLKQYMHLDNFQQSQTFEYCTMPLAIDYNSSSDNNNQQNANNVNTAILSEQNVDEINNTHHSTGGRNDIDGESTTNSMSLSTSPIVGVNSEISMPIVGNNDCMDMYVPQHPLSTSSMIPIEAAAGPVDSYIYQNNPYQLMDRDYSGQFTGVPSIYSPASQIPAEMMPFYTLPIQSIGMPMSDDYYIYDGTNSMATAGYTMVPFSMGGSTTVPSLSSENGAGGIPGYYPPYFPAYIHGQGTGTPTGGRGAMFYVCGNNGGVNMAGGSSIAGNNILPTMAPSSAQTASYPALLTSSPLYNTISTTCFNTAHHMTSDNNTTAVVAVDQHQQYPNNRDSIATTSDERVASSSLSYSSKLNNFKQPLVINESQDNYQQQLQLQTQLPESDIEMEISVDELCNKSESTLNENTTAPKNDDINTNTNENNDIIRISNDNNNNTIINTNIDFEAKKSTDLNGSDLPNLPTLRYFYNLGVDYYSNHLKKSSQRPSAKVEKGLSLTTSAASTSVVTAATTSSLSNTQHSGTISTLQYSMIHKTDVKNTAKDSLAVGFVPYKSTLHQQSTSSSSSSAPLSGAGRGYRGGSTIFNQQHYRSSKNLEGRSNFNITTPPTGYHSRKPSRDGIFSSKQYSNHTSYLHQSHHSYHRNQQYSQQPYHPQQQQYPPIAHRAPTNLSSLSYNNPSVSQITTSRHHQAQVNLNGNHHHYQQQQSQHHNYNYQHHGEIEGSSGYNSYSTTNRGGAGRGNLNMNGIDHVMMGTSIQQNAGINNAIMVENANSAGSYNNSQSFLPILPQSSLVPMQMGPVYGCLSQQQLPPPTALMPQSSAPGNQQYYTSATTNFQNATEVSGNSHNKVSQRRNSNKLPNDTVAVTRSQNTNNNQINIDNVNNTKNNNKQSDKGLKKSGCNECDSMPRSVSSSNISKASGNAKGNNNIVSPSGDGEAGGAVGNRPSASTLSTYANVVSSSTKVVSSISSNGSDAEVQSSQNQSVTTAPKQIHGHNIKTKLNGRKQCLN